MKETKKWKQPPQMFYEKESSENFFAKSTEKDLLPQSSSARLLLKMILKPVKTRLQGKRNYDLTISCYEAII